MEEKKVREVAGGPSASELLLLLFLIKKMEHALALSLAFCVFPGKDINIITLEAKGVGSSRVRLYSRWWLKFFLFLPPT